MKTTKLILFFICLNLAAFAIYASGAYPAILPEQYQSPESIIGIFKIENWKITDWILLGSVGLFTALLMVLTRQYMFGSIVIILWVIGCFVAPIGWLVYGFPKFVGDIIYTTGAGSVDATTLSVIVTGILSALFVYSAFTFIMELAAQRQTI